jgi:hypothetical protein
MAVEGHEDQFRPPSLSGCCRLGEETSAGMGGKEEDAPKAVAKGLADARVIVRPGLGVGGSRAMPNHSGGNREIFFVLGRAKAYCPIPLHGTGSGRQAGHETIFGAVEADADAAPRPLV